MRQTNDPMCPSPRLDVLAAFCVGHGEPNKAQIQTTIHVQSIPGIFIILGIRNEPQQVVLCQKVKVAVQEKLQKDERSARILVVDLFRSLLSQQARSACRRRIQRVCSCRFMILLYGTEQEATVESTSL